MNPTMTHWITSVVLVALAVLAFLWLQTDAIRLDWRQARRRARCPHREPGVESVAPTNTPGEVKTVYYCPDCKSLWAVVSQVPREEWERLAAGKPGRAAARGQAEDRMAGPQRRKGSE